jgi:hypothetical protein
LAAPAPLLFTQQRRIVAGIVDQALQDGWMWTSLALWIGVRSESVFLQFFKQEHVVLAVEGRRWILDHGLPRIAKCTPS